MYDIIGDIHGHSDELVALLDLLGYEKHGTAYSHHERKVVFVGDFIDRGPKIRETLEIVRPMVEEGHAMSVMGNHELNALAYHTADPESPGEFLRRHGEKNRKQHSKTVGQLSPGEMKTYLDWFRTLPMWLDLDGLRVVHACWDDQAIILAKNGYDEHGGVTTPFLQSACLEGRTLIVPVEILLKGKEVGLPEGVSFADKDGHVRTQTRVRWHLPPEGHTYRTYALTDEINCDLPIEESVARQALPYPASAKPVFVGHYWLSALRPAVLSPNVACVDYSVAKGGFLCAYRWHGEQTLNNDHFVWIK